MNSCYLITGGAGFIGSNLADSLIKNNRIIVIDNFDDYYPLEIKKNNIKNNLTNTNYKFENVDIRNKEELERVFSENKIDLVVHLAGIGGVRNSIENPIKYQEVNCIGTQNVLEAMKKYDVKNIIFASSSSVYGNCKDVPFRENYDCNYPISPYAQTKKACEMMLYVYHNLYNFNVIANRFFTVYGRRMRPDLAICKFTKNILNGKEIPFYGDGTTYRDYTYIDDIVKGIESGIDYLKSNENVYEIINLGSGNPITLVQMVEILEKTLNKKAIINKMKMQSGDVDATYADISKARKLLNYEPKYSFEEGIEEFVKWYLGDICEKG